MAGQLQSLERQGDVMSRNMKREQFSTELGMSQNRLASANLARQQATQAMLGGIGNVISGGINAQTALQGTNDPLNALTGRI